MNGWTAFVVHVLVVAAISIVVAMLASGRIGRRLAVVVVVLCMAATFWTICSLSGSTVGVAESWLAIGFVTTGYCLRLEETHASKQAGVTGSGGDRTAPPLPRPPSRRRR